MLEFLKKSFKPCTPIFIDVICSENFSKYSKDFVSAAVSYKRAVFDGVGLHAAHGMYLKQIIETSTRKDGYGEDDRHWRQRARLEPRSRKFRIVRLAASGKSHLLHCS